MALPPWWTGVCSGIRAWAVLARIRDHHPSVPGGEWNNSFVILVYQPPVRSHKVTLVLRWAASHTSLGCHSSMSIIITKTTPKARLPVLFLKGNCVMSCRKILGQKGWTAVITIFATICFVSYYVTGKPRENVGLYLVIVAPQVY